MNIEEIYNRFKNGDSLTDEELDFFIEHMEQLELKLRELGSDFHMVHQFVIHKLIPAREYRHHRQHG